MFHSVGVAVWSEALPRIAGVGLFPMECVCLSRETTNSAASLLCFSTSKSCFVFEITTRLFQPLCTLANPKE